MGRRRKEVKEIHILSLGAGVQSSTIALMAAKGEIGPMPCAAIFADTKAEPRSVYLWLDWLETQLPFPLYRVTQGEGLERDALKVRRRKDGKGNWVPSGVPHYSINADGTHGHGPRQCTADFKIRPIMRKARDLMKEHEAQRFVQWIGISLDEIIRMKPSRVRYAVNWHPLIDLRLRRHDCLLWMARNGYPRPPRSACRFCPYKSNAEWKYLKENEPGEFAMAVDFERSYQQAKASTVSQKGFMPFLHAARKPLDQVDFSSDLDRGQGWLFGNECSGMCGV